MMWVLFTKKQKSCVLDLNFESPHETPASIASIDQRYTQACFLQCNSLGFSTLLAGNMSATMNVTIGNPSSGREEIIMLF